MTPNLWRGVVTMDPHYYVDRFFLAINTLPYPT